MKNLIIFFLFSSTFTLSQPGKFLQRNEPFDNNKLIPTTLVLPADDSKISLFYLYRVPYNHLIFELDGNSYKSSVRILIEIYDDDELVSREFIDKDIFVNDFELVESKSASLQGAIHFNLSDKEYIIKGSLTDLNSEKEFPFRPVNLDCEKLFESVTFNPIIINPNETGCNGSGLPLIVNQGNAIPFSSVSNSMVIPVADTTISSVQVKVMKNGEEILTFSTDEYIRGRISVAECDGKVYISTGSEGSETNNFIIGDLNLKLSEGTYNLIIKLNEEQESDFPLMVRWIDKPISLRNPEFAIEILKYIEADSVLAEMLDYDEDEYPAILNDYWRKFDPTPDTEFNELMEEFYSRIDFAAMEFRGLGKKNGISTDRGRVYIQNGKPDNIERTSNELGNVVEIWKYKKMNKVFHFVDKQGTGNFVLIES